MFIRKQNLGHTISESDSRILAYSLASLLWTHITFPFFSLLKRMSRHLPTALSLPKSPFRFSDFFHFQTTRCVCFCVHFCLCFCFSNPHSVWKQIRKQPTNLANTLFSPFFLSFFLIES